MNAHGAAHGGAIVLLVSALGCSTSSTVTSSPRFSQASDTTFAVGAASVLEVESFAGTAVVKPGNPGVIDVVATKWAGRPEHLDEIELEMATVQDTVRLRTTNPSALTGVSVDFDVAVPADARPMLSTGAGSLVYVGRPNGECSFSTGAGDITLRLPPDVNVEVHLTVGVGSIQVAFPVDGQVGVTAVHGVIGTGADGTIVANVGAGRIIVTRQ